MFCFQRLILLLVLNYFIQYNPKNSLTIYNKEFLSIWEAFDMNNIFLVFLPQLFSYENNAFEFFLIVN